MIGFLQHSSLRWQNNQSEKKCFVCKAWKPLDAFSLRFTAFVEEARALPSQAPEWRAFAPRCRFCTIRAEISQLLKLKSARCNQSLPISLGFLHEQWSQDGGWYCRTDMETVADCNEPPASLLEVWQEQKGKCNHCELDMALSWIPENGNMVGLLPLAWDLESQSLVHRLCHPLALEQSERLAATCTWQMGQLVQGKAPLDELEMWKRMLSQRKEKERKRKEVLDITAAEDASYIASATAALGGAASAKRQKNK